MVEMFQSQKKSVICNKDDIDFQKLKLHLQMLPDAVKATPLDGVYARKVTRVQTICDLFNEQSSIKALLSEVHKLILIYLTPYLSLQQ